MSELDAKWLELVKAGRAEWMPGMLDQAGYTFLNSADGSLWDEPRWDYGWGWAWLPVEGRLPNWSDPATLGALLGQVRARWKDPATHAVPDGDWHVRGDLPWAQYGTGDTEAEALLAALEAAP